MAQRNRPKALALGGGTLDLDPNPFVTTQASWSQTDWYVDPVNGLDTNPGTSTAPVKTVMGGIVAAWGTPSPTLAQNTTIHLLNSQAPGAENIILTPTMVGGSNFAIIGTLAALGNTFHPASVTAKNRATPQLLVLNGMPAAAAAGLVVYNVTKQSYAVIDFMTGSNATMGQPLAAAGLMTITAVPSYSEDDTWAAGDTYQLYTPPNLNLKVFASSGGGSNAAGTAPTAWLQFFNVPDTSGTPGFDTFSPTAVNGSQLIMSLLTTTAFFRAEGGSAPFNFYAAGCYAPNGAQMVATNVIGGAYNVNLSANQTLVDEISSIDGDAIFHGTLVIKGNPYVICGLAYCDTLVSLAHNATMLIEADTFASANLWGPTAVNLEGPISCVQNATGGTWANCLTVKGAITIEGIGTGTKVVDGAPSVWTSGIAISAAALDTNNGLQNPRTGSRFSTN